MHVSQYFGVLHFGSFISIEGWLRAGPTGTDCITIRSQQLLRIQGPCTLQVQYMCRYEVSTSLSPDFTTGPETQMFSEARTRHTAACNHTHSSRICTPIYCRRCAQSSLSLIAMSRHRLGVHHIVSMHLDSTCNISNVATPYADTLYITVKMPFMRVSGKGPAFYQKH